MIIASLSEEAGAQRIERWSSVLEAEVLPLYDTPIGTDDGTCPRNLPIDNRMLYY